MKKKEIKLIVFISILLIIFSIFIFLTFKSHDYEKEYKIDNYKIIEKYNKEDKYYTFYIKDSKINYPYIIKSKYTNRRELINEIKEVKNEEEKCILPISDELNFYPLCNKEESIYTYNLSDTKEINFNYKKINKINTNFEKIKINTLNNHSFLIFNYKGFYWLNENKNKEINLFEKDVYNIELIYQLENFVIIPDYDQDYYFNKFYIIDVLKGKVEELEISYDISYESTFLGDYKKNIYLVDKKEEKEYKINLNKKTVETIEAQILENNKLVKKDIKKIINNNLKFSKKPIYNYDIIENTLYLNVNNIKIKLSDKKIDKIIKIDNDTIYYLSTEELYMFNNVYGEILLLSNFEWNFNNTNMIFLSK